MRRRKEDAEEKQEEALDDWAARRQKVVQGWQGERAKLAAATREREATTLSAYLPRRVYEKRIKKSFTEYYSMKCTYRQIESEL